MPARFPSFLFVACLLLTIRSHAVPVIVSGTHSPPLPVPGDAVSVSAEITGATQASLQWRVDGSAAFKPVTMSVAGATWSGTIPSQANGTVVEFLVVASGGGTATWPSATQTALLRFEENALPGSSWIPGAPPVWRLLTRVADATTLAAGSPVQSSIVIRDGSGFTVRHACELRQRETLPKAYGLSFPNGSAWQGRQSVNLSADRPHAQAFGAAVFARAGLPAAAVETVEVRLNGVNAAAAGSPSYGRFALSEPFDAQWAARQFPASAGGNLYRMDDSGPGTHGELGYETPATAANYAETYKKLAGTAPADYADVISLTDKLSNAPDATYRQEIGQQLDLDQWLRFLAWDSLLGNGEPGLQTGRGTDVVLYHLPSSDRMLMVPHEMRAIMGLGASAGTASRSLYSSEATAGLSRMMTHPDILSRLIDVVFHEMTHHFTSGMLDPLIDQLMGGWVDSSEVAAAKQYIIDRRAAVLAQLPSPAPVVNITGEAAAVEGMATTATGSITLSGSFPVGDVDSITVNGVPATLHFRTAGTSTAGTWTFTATEANGALRRGTNVFTVEFWTGTGGTGPTFLTTTGQAYYSGGGTTVTSIASGVEVRWTPAGSPYRLASDRSVPTSSTLVIEPGVSVYFNPGRKLTVNGVLRVLGTKYGRVRFSHPPGATPVDNPVVPGTQLGPPKWAGVAFQSSVSPNNLIAYADFENAQVTGFNGSVTMRNSRCVIDHCSFRGTYLHAIYADNCSIIVQDSSFPDSYAPGTESAAAGSLDNASEYIQMGGSSWPAGAVLRFYRNTFGGVPGHNDIMDISSGKWGVSPVLDVQDNIFLGHTGDEVMDLEGDAYVAGNFFSNIRKDEWTSDLGNSNAVSIVGGASQTTIVMARNVFTRVDHQATAKGDSGVIFEHNTVACQHGDYLFTGGNENQMVRSGVVAFWIAEDPYTPGNGAYLGYNIFFGSAGHPAGAAGGFPRIFAGADLGGNSTFANKIEMFANFIDPAIQDPVIGPRHPNNVLHPDPDSDGIPSSQGVTGNPQFTNIAEDDYSILPTSPALGTAPHGLDYGLDYGATIPKGCYLVNLPPLVTASSSASILVGGPGIFAYKWRLNGGAWSNPVSIAPGVFSRTTPTVRTANLALSNLAAGMQSLEVIGQDFAGNWTLENEATRASWTVNTTTPLLFLSEVQAGAGGGIEIFNGGATSIALTGWSLTDNAATPGKYSLAGELAAGAFLTLPASLTGIILSSSGGSAFLFQNGVQRDAIAFGPQSTAHSLGRTGRERVLKFGTPTPHAANNTVETGSISSLRFSEWLAGDSGWVELVNTDAKPVVLDHAQLSAAIPGTAVPYEFPDNSIIGAGGYLMLTAPGPLPFTLDGLHATLTLLNDGAVIDSIHLSRAAPGSSEGRDTSGRVVFFPVPTPGVLNSQPVPATFEAWLSQHGVTQNSDDDRDGSIAFAEYSLATDPKDARSVSRPELLPRNGREADGSVRFSFSLPQNGSAAGRADVIAIVETALNPVAGPWTAVATKSGTGAWTGPATATAGAAEGGFVPVTVRIASAAGGDLFARLRLRPL